MRDQSSLNTPSTRLSFVEHGQIRNFAMLAASWQASLQLALSDDMMLLPLMPVHCNICWESGCAELRVQVSMAFHLLPPPPPHQI